MKRKLKEIATYIGDGNWIESKNQSENGTIWLIQTGNIGIKEFKPKMDKKHFITEETYKKLDCTEVKNGDILISRLPDPVGRSCVLKNLTEKCITAVDCTILRIDETNFDKDYIINFLNSNTYFKQVLANITGTTRKRISRKKLENINVPIYNIKNKKRIAKELNTYTNLINNNNIIIQKLNDLILSYFYDKFGNIEKNPNNYKIKKISDVCENIVRGPFGSSLKKEFFVEKNENTYKVYEQKNAIQKNSNIGNYYIDSKKYEELKRFKCKEGDIIMSCSGTIGKLYLLPKGIEEGIINQALCKFTLNNTVTPNYFLVFMENIIKNVKTQGTSIKNIGAVQYIKNLDLLVPPLNIQIEFDNLVNAIHNCINKIENQNTLLKELYNIKCNTYFN